MSNLLDCVLPLATFNRQHVLKRVDDQDRTAVRRRELEAFVTHRFAETYGADPKHFMPQLLGLYRNDLLQAVVGLRPASTGPLPASTLIRLRSGIPVQYPQVVEVGNLAALAPGAARMLITALTHYLAALGFTWVVFTGTAMLLNSFQRLNLSPIDLGLADPARLGEQQADWGSYYATRPRVMAGYIPEGLAQLIQRDAFARLGYQFMYAQQEERAHVSA